MNRDARLVQLAAGVAAVGVVLAASTPPAQRVARATTTTVKRAVTPTPGLVLPVHLEPWSRLIERSAAVNGVRPYLLAAIVHVESSGNPRAVRPHAVPDWIAAGTALMNRARSSGWTNEQLAASYGLCQILGGKAWAIGYRGDREGLFDPARSVEFGARVLRACEVRFKSDFYALAAYNGGEGAAYALLRGEPHAASAYAVKVLALERQLIAGAL